MSTDDNTTTDNTATPTPKYKPTSPKEQSRAVFQYLVTKHGRRESEAAMELATMKPKKLRRLYQSLVMLGEVKQ